ncbi:MAG TPA: coproporphyrinogen III oxidase family protein, partial [Thermomicrobiales bacterium]|nr:coproporphyrinogen III oxidase family protein [Thermomicrobiales bacterium]
AVKRGILIALDDDTAADQYERAVDTLGAAGWEHYEVANWAREPRFRSRHNQLYWQNGPYHGFGAGAHGTLRSTRHSNVLLPIRYIEAVEAGQRPVAHSESLSPETELGETMMLGLRLLIDGVSMTDVIARHGVDPRERFASEITRFFEIGMLEWNGDGHDRLRLTPPGALLANDVCAAFVATAS